MTGLFKKISVKYAVVALVVAFLSVGVMVQSARQSGATIGTVSSSACTSFVCLCGFGCCPYWYSLCVTPGTSTTYTTTTLENLLKTGLEAAAATLENFISAAVNAMVTAYLATIQLMEMNVIAWWRILWAFDLRPSLQDLGGQTGSTNIDQGRSQASLTDATEQNETMLAQEEEAANRVNELIPSEASCEAASEAGGLARQMQVSKAMRGAQERTDQQRILNSTGSTGAGGQPAVLRERFDNYRNTFCDPQENSGSSGCAAAGALPGADIKVTDTLFNKLTIDVTDPNQKMALDTLIENMVGLDKTSPISDKSMDGPIGQEAFLNRRAYIARRSAAKSVARLIASWRMPGSRNNTFLQALRQDAGVAPSTISSNPSYNEVMHAIAVDDFLSGKFGLDAIDTDSNVEHKKLMLSVFQLMESRRYFELLERQALVLAVEVGMLLDDRQDVSVAGSGKAK